MRQTTIINNVVTPRYYHIYEDNIESKGVMEAIGTSVGTGPVIGFDIIDTTKNYLSVTGVTNPNYSFNTLSPKQQTVKGLTKYLKLSNKANQSGFVVNAHITPDGILSIDPVVIDIPSMAIDWTSINNGSSCKVIALIASHVYEETSDEEGIIMPSTSNFRAVDLTMYFTENILTKPLSAHWSTQSGTMTFAMSVASGFNRNTETLIGLYILGDTNYSTETQGYYNTYGKVFPLIPYNNQWPLYNNLGDRYMNKLFENLYYQLPESSKELNWTHIFITKEMTADYFELATEDINVAKSFNLPTNLEIGTVGTYNVSYEIYPGIYARRVYFEIMIPGEAVGFQNIIDSTLKLDVETSASQDVPVADIRPVLHKSIQRYYNQASNISYISCDVLIKSGTITTNNKYPIFKISFASL